MENPLNEAANAAYEQRMIDLKLGDRGRSEPAWRSSFARAWDLLPEWVRESKALQRAKAAYRGSRVKAENPYARVCMMSFMNYVLNRKLELPARADGEYLAGAKRVLEYFISGASGGPLSWKALYSRELYDRIEYRSGYFEFEGRKLRKKLFSPEVFLHHHGLRLLPASVVSQVREGSILDVGAGMGDSAVVLSDYTDRNVYSFECDDASFADLKQNVQLNDLRNVRPIKAAVGLEDGLLEFDGFPRDFYFHHEPQNGIRMETASLDLLCRKNGIERVSCIKMDIEGFELEALQGAAGIIKAGKPVIIASVYHTGKDFFGIPLFLEKLNPDYRFRLVFLNDEPPTKEVNLIAY
jgi:FkbM family methyltransferase